MDAFDLAVACIALTVYGEADWRHGHVSAQEQISIAYVASNRARIKNINVCDAVFEPMQFSWTNRALEKYRMMLPENLPKDNPRWKRSRLVARMVMNKKVDDPTHGATHYHATYVSPVWVDDDGMHPVGRFGTHLFYTQENYGSKISRRSALAARAKRIPLG